MNAPRGAAALLLFVCGGGVAAQEWTEAQVIEAFLNQSLHAREVKARVDAVRAEAAGRTLLSNPSAVLSREGAGYASFYQLEQQLPWPGRRGLLKQAGTAAVSVAEADGAAALWTLRSDLRAALYRMAAAQRRELVLSDGLRDLEGVIRVLRSRESEGEGSKYDRLRAERELAEYRSQLALAGTEIAQARSQLSAFLPARTSVQRVVATDYPVMAPPSLDLLVPRALSHRFEFVSEQRQIERYRLEQRAAGRLRYHDPTVALGMKRGDVTKGETETSSAVGITTQLPLFNKGQTEVARWSAELEASSARRDAIERRIRAEVAGATEAVRLRIAAVEQYRREVGPLGDDLNRILRVAYEEGEVGILEPLDSLSREPAIPAADRRSGVAREGSTDRVGSCHRRRGEAMKRIFVARAAALV